jgi:hypothetical protein
LLVVMVLGTVPVLVPLLFTGGPAPLAAPAARPTGATAPDLSRPARPVTGDRSARDAKRSPLPPAPTVGALTPTTTTTTTTTPPAPTATPATSPPPASGRPAASSASPPTPTATPAPPVAPAAAPDLVVVAVSWSPATPANGNQVTFNATVRNAGSDPTPGGSALAVAFSVDGMTVTWSDGRPAPLLPNESRTLTATAGTAGATWTATVGTHEVLASVDDAGLIGESDEGNNTATVTLTVD